MPGSATIPDVTNMIDLHPLGDWLDKAFIRKAMNVPHSTLVFDCAVTVVRLSASPKQGKVCPYNAPDIPHNAQVFSA